MREKEEQKKKLRSETTQITMKQSINKQMEKAANSGVTATGDGAQAAEAVAEKPLQQPGPSKRTK